jgi:PKHD-type hydroxylase
MLLALSDILSPEQLAETRRRLEAVEWGDGRVTAGPQSAQVKDNLQLDELHPETKALGQMIVRALERHPLFLSASLAKQVFPPLFNLYRGGMGFGSHVDNAIRAVPGTGMRLRTDISATLFLSDPDTYDGGELVIEDSYGEQAVKLAAGSLILYPTTSLHRVTPVTSGARLAAFFWIQSLVKDAHQRRILFEMDRSIQALTRDMPEHPSVLTLTNCYHNLVRQWAEI